MSDFGLYIRELREKRNMSLNQLALYAGVSSSLLSKVENGKRRPPKPETIEKLAKGLKISYEELMHKAGHIDFIEMPEHIQQALDDGFISRDDLAPAPFYDNGKMGVKYELKYESLLKLFEELEKKHDVDLSDPAAIEMLKKAFELVSFAKEKNTE